MRELIFRREASIRSRVRSSALRLANALPNDVAKQLARDAVYAYDARSSLVHDGYLEETRLSNAIERGHRAVKEMLRPYFQQEAQAEA